MKNKFRFRNILLFVIALALVLSVLLPRFLADTKKEKVRVERKDISTKASSSGTLQSDKKAILKFQSTGKLTALNVKRGDGVKRGQTIAKLDTGKISVDYQKALSDLRSADATLERVYDEIKGNDKTESFLLKEKRTIAEVSRDKAYDNLRRIQKEIADFFIISPLDGIVTFISEGFFLGGNVSLSDYLIVEDGKNLNFVADVDEFDYSKVTIDQEVDIKIDAFPGEVFKGKVIEIAKTTEKLSTGGISVPVKIDISFDQRFISGLSGEVDFVEEEKKGILVVPKKAIFKENGEYFVYLVNDKEIPVKVVIGLWGDKEVEIKEGLKEGDLILADFSSRK